MNTEENGEDHNLSSGNVYFFKSFADLQIALPLPIPSVDATQYERVVAGVRDSVALTAAGELEYICEGIFQSSNGHLSRWKPDDAIVVDAACGFRHVVALDSLNRVWTWGSNVRGALGRSLHESMAHDAQPGLVVFDGSLRDVRWVEVNSGWSHVVIRGVRSDGTTVFAGWGRSDMGQLPRDDSQLSAPEKRTLLPTCLTKLPGGHHFTDVWTAAESTFATDEGGLLWSSGWNEHGNLGTGDCENRVTWSQVSTANKDGQLRQIRLALRNCAEAFACSGSHCFAIIDCSAVDDNEVRRDSSTAVAPNAIDAVSK